jgi:hypothetical protein
MDSPKEQKTFRILIADAAVERTNRFLIQGEGTPYHLSIVRTEKNALDALRFRDWDILFTSLFLGDWQKHLTLVPAIVSSYRLKQLRAVICYSPVKNDGKEFMKAMKNCGVPAKWIPYDYANPSKHVVFSEIEVGKD